MDPSRPPPVALEQSAALVDELLRLQERLEADRSPASRLRRSATELAEPVWLEQEPALAWRTLGSRNWDLREESSRPLDPCRDCRGAR